MLCKCGSVTLGTCVGFKLEGKQTLEPLSLSRRPGIWTSEPGLQAQTGGQGILAWVSGRGWLKKGSKMGGGDKILGVVGGCG